MTENNNIIQTFTEMAPRYEEIVDVELRNFWGWSYSGVVDSLFKDLLAIENKKILDIATGTGVIPARLVKNGVLGNHIHGLDITRAMLEQAKQRFNKSDVHQSINLVCASAMEMPYATESFSLAICGLATHHMSIDKLLSEVQRILQCDGELTIADAGGMNYWKVPGIKFLLKAAAFVYFSMNDGPSRAWSEADAVSNVRSKDEWFSFLLKYGFKDISIVELKSKYSWISAPLIIKAVKS